MRLLSGLSASRGLSVLAALACRLHLGCIRHAPYLQPYVAHMQAHLHVTYLCYPDSKCLAHPSKASNLIKNIPATLEPVWGSVPLGSGPKMEPIFWYSWSAPTVSGPRGLPAPQTNSKAISWRCCWDGPGTCYVDSKNRSLASGLACELCGAVSEVHVGCIRDASDMQVPKVHFRLNASAMHLAYSPP